MLFNVSDSDRLRAILATNQEDQRALFALEGLISGQADLLTVNRYIAEVRDPVKRRALQVMRDQINGLATDVDALRAVNVVRGLKWRRSAARLAASSLTAQALAILRTYGTDAHLWLPGVGVVNGITAGNFSDTAGTTASVVDSTAGVGLVVDAGGGTINTTQGTTANKPILRRGVVNRATASNDLALWAPSNASFADSGIALPFGSGNATRITLTASPMSLNRTLTKPSATALTVTGSIYAHSSSIPFTLSIDDSGTSNRCLVVCTPLTGSVGSVTNSGAFSAGAASVESVGGGWYRFILRATTDAGASYRLRPFASGTAGESVVLAYAQLEHGSTASPYVPTTTAAASSPTGPMYWELDGTDFLTLGSVPFQQADGQVVIAAAAASSYSAQRMVCAPSCSASTFAKNASVLFGTDGAPRARWTNNTPTDFTVTSPSAMPAGQAAVLTARKVGTTGSLRVNGAAQGTPITISGTITADSGGIGTERTSNPSGLFIGNIGPVIAIKGTVSDADLLILEKWIGSLSGVPI